MSRYISVLLLFFVGILFATVGKNSLIAYAEKCGDVVVINNDENIVLEVTGDYMEFVELLDIKIDKNFEIEDRLILEGYSAMLSNYICIDNRKINIQLSICDDSFIVGYPLIKNSF